MGLGVWTGASQTAGDFGFGYIGWLFDAFASWITWILAQNWGWKEGRDRVLKIREERKRSLFDFQL